MKRGVEVSTSQAVGALLRPFPARNNGEMLKPSSQQPGVHVNQHAGDVRFRQRHAVLQLRLRLHTTEVSNDRLKKSEQHILLFNHASHVFLCLLLSNVRGVCSRCRDRYAVTANATSYAPIAFALQELFWYKSQHNPWSTVDNA